MSDERTLWMEEGISPRSSQCPSLCEEASRRPSGQRASSLRAACSHTILRTLPPVQADVAGGGAAGFVSLRGRRFAIGFVDIGVWCFMLISEEYRKQQEWLHQNPNYGVASVQFAPLVAQLVNQFGVREILDYGAGKGRLAQHLKPAHPVRMLMYDPAIPEWSSSPSPCEMVACIDVLEHIEPGCLEDVLDHLASLVIRLGFFTVHTGPAVKTLPDGRNAHLIQQPPAWWLPKILQRFELLMFQRTPQGFWVLVANRNVKIG